MTRAGSAIAAFAVLSFAVLSFAGAPAFAQSTNDGKPSAPEPSKAAPMETGGKPKTDGGGAMTKKSAGGMKSGGMMKKKKHR